MIKSRIRKILGARFRAIGPRFFLGMLSLSLGVGCSIMAKRPTQAYSDARAALLAAREVKAESLAPELFRQAQEWMEKGESEYQFKNFDEARRAFDVSRFFAEKAEFEVLVNGGTRTSIAPPPQFDEPPPAPEDNSLGNESDEGGVWAPLLKEESETAPGAPPT